MDETIPSVIEASTLADYLEVMTRAVFQAGVKWSQIATRWEAYRTAFESFSPIRVALYGEYDVERILATPGILRMRRKIQATIRNAQRLLEIERECGAFPVYLCSFDSYGALAKALKRDFALMGDMNVWFFLFLTGHPVPQFETWVPTIRGDHPRMREMVDRARAAGRSRETAQS